jgi:acyl carrier protein
MKKKEKIVKELENFFIKKEGKEILKSIKKKNLIQSGLIDSLDILTLSSILQKKFNYKVNLNNPKILKSFEKFEKIVGLIK